MIDFNKLRTLMSKARSASAGKPLDNVRTLSSPSVRQGDNMNNTRLFQRSEKDWSVQLPGAVLMRFPGTLAAFCEGLNRAPLDEIEIAHVQHVIAVGAGVRGSWWRAVNKDKPVELEDLERGLESCKRDLFRINGVFASERIPYELEIPPAKLVNNNGHYTIVSSA